MESINDLQAIRLAEVGNQSFTISSIEGIRVQEQIDQDSYTIWIDDETFSVRFIRSNSISRTYEFKINQEFFVVKLQRTIDLRVIELGFSDRKHMQLKSLIAPMPGLIKKIEIVAGGSIVPGQPLVVLEAMKMENVIKANHTGQIKSILVVPGQIVEKGQHLMDFND